MTKVFPWPTAGFAAGTGSGSSTRRACCGTWSTDPAPERPRPALQAGRRRARPGTALRHTAAGAATGRRVRPRCAAPRRWDVRVRAGNTARWSSWSRCSGSSPKDLPRPQALGHGRRDKLGHRLFQLLRNAFGQHRGAFAAHRLVERRIQMQSLAAAGEREGSQADPGDQVAHGARHLDICAIVTPSPGSRSNTNRVAGPGLSSSARLRVHSATNRHCGT